MSSLSFSAATRRIRDTMFGRSNRELVDHWLRLWRADELPYWSDLDLAALPRHDPGISVFALHPDDRLICLRSGEAVRRLLGLDPGGMDWLAMAEPHQRAIRLSGFRSIASGFVGHCIRYGEHRSGEVHYIEEVLLPFAPDRQVHTVLSHIGWRPNGPDGDPSPEIRNSRMTPDEVLLIPLAAEPEVL